MRLLDTLRSTLDQTDNTTETPSITTSDALDVLSNARRRKIIAYLAEHDDTVVPVRDIADHLAATGDDRTAAYVACLQQHIPRMESYGIVEYDEPAKQVAVCEEVYVLSRVKREIDRILA
jgi:ribosomal protein S24E